MTTLKLTHPRSKTEYAIMAICLILLISITGCKLNRAVGQNGEYFESMSFAYDTEFNGFMRISDPNSNLDIIVIDNYNGNAETGEAGTLIGNVLKTLLRP